MCTGDRKGLRREIDSFFFRKSSSTETLHYATCKSWHVSASIWMGFALCFLRPCFSLIATKAPSGKTSDMLYAFCTQISLGESQNYPQGSCTPKVELTNWINKFVGYIHRRIRPTWIFSSKKLRSSSSLVVFSITFSSLSMIKGLSLVHGNKAFPEWGQQFHSIVVW